MGMPSLEIRTGLTANLLNTARNMFEMLTSDMPTHDKGIWFETHSKAMWYKLRRQTTRKKELQRKFLHKEIWYKGTFEEIK